MKIAITGAGGFVGRALMKSLEGAEAVPSLQHKTEDEIRALIENLDADVLIHTAAMADIGECAADPEGSYLANVTLPVWIAQYFKGKKLIIFSSDQVYSGSLKPGPYTEDMALPDNLYSKEKIEMESRVSMIRPDAVFLRAEWMYDFESPRRHYYNSILTAEKTIAESSGEFRGVTYVREVAEVMPKVFELPGGAYNFGSETERSIHDITRDFVNYIGKDIEVIDRAPGHNLWMDCSKAAAYGVSFSEVLEGLKKCAEDHRASKKDTEV